MHAHLQHFSCVARSSVSCVRCIGTFGNYLGYLRGACHARGYEAPPLGHPAIKRAMVAIVKRELFDTRPKFFIRKALLLEMVLAVNRRLEEFSFAMLWLVTYTWLLRLPSEVRACRVLARGLVHRHIWQALPLCVGRPDSPSSADEQTLIWKEGDEICLRLRRRKNRPKGSGTMRRVCTCKGSVHICPVHVLWDKFLDKMPEGSHPWSGVSAGLAMIRLRRVLEQLQLQEAASYRTQDLRRGHAEVSASCLKAQSLIFCASCDPQEMRKSGCSLAEVLRAGQWRSAAFMKYLDEADLEKVGFLQPTCWSPSVGIRPVGRGFCRCNPK